MSFFGVKKKPKKVYEHEESEDVDDEEYEEDDENISLPKDLEHLTDRELLLVIIKLWWYSGSLDNEDIKDAIKSAVEARKK